MSTNAAVRSSTSMNVKTLTRTAILIALLVALQYATSSLGQFVTGSCVNLVLAVAAMLCGPVSGLIVAVVSPFFAYLFGIDLASREFVWLNAAREGIAAVAGATSLGFLTRYFRAASVIHMYSFFEMMASELTEDPAGAEVIVSDRSMDAISGAEIVRSCDFDKVLALMNR